MISRRAPPDRGEEHGGSFSNPSVNHVPHDKVEWYVRSVDGSFDVVMGDRGRLVVPAKLRTDLGWTTGTRLFLIETDVGVVVMTIDQLEAYVRRDLAGLDLVTELLTERRVAARAGE